MEWNKYPIGTKAYAIMGGYWERTSRGWKWCTGATFPTPGGDVSRIELPVAPSIIQCAYLDNLQKEKKMKTDYRRKK